MGWQAEPERVSAWPKPARHHLHFTHRQRQMVLLIALGYSNAEIARHLGISNRTARAHCDTVRLKLGVETRREIPSAYRLLTGDDVLAEFTAAAAAARAADSHPDAA